MSQNLSHSKPSVLWKSPAGYGPAYFTNPSLIASQTHRTRREDVERLVTTYSYREPREPRLWQISLPDNSVTFPQKQSHRSPPSHPCHPPRPDRNYMATWITLNPSVATTTSLALGWVACLSRSLVWKINSCRDLAFQSRLGEIDNIRALVE